MQLADKTAVSSVHMQIKKDITGLFVRVAGTSGLGHIGVYDCRSNADSPLVLSSQQTGRVDAGLCAISPCYSGHLLAGTGHGSLLFWHASDLVRPVAAIFDHHRTALLKIVSIGGTVATVDSDGVIFFFDAEVSKLALQHEHRERREERLGDLMELAESLVSPHAEDRIASIRHQLERSRQDITERNSVSTL